MKLYLAGPMSGYPDYNVPEFMRVGSLLRAAGHEVSIPCDHDEPEDSRTWEQWMDRDIRMALDCEAVAVLPGWERSRGASLEVLVMHTLGRPVLNALDLSPVELGDGCARLAVASKLLLAWSRSAFPQRRAEPTRLHLHRELSELAENPADRMELADVLMLALALADCEGVHPADAVLDKLEVVKRRRWSAPDADGVVEHERGAAA